MSRTQNDPGPVWTGRGRVRGSAGGSAGPRYQSVRRVRWIGSPDPACHPVRRARMRLSTEKPAITTTLATRRRIVEASVIVLGSIGCEFDERGQVLAAREVPEQRDELVAVPERRGSTCSHVP